MDGHLLTLIFIMIILFTNSIFIIIIFSQGFYTSTGAFGLLRADSGFTVHTVQVEALGKPFNSNNAFYNSPHKFRMLHLLFMFFFFYKFINPSFTRSHTSWLLKYRFSFWFCFTGCFLWAMLIMGCNESVSKLRGWMS